MSKLWLDDIRPAPDETWNIVKTYKSFVAHIQKYGMPDLISFDNDLGFNQKEGYDCAKWLIDNNYIVKDFQVHSANPIAKENITCLLENWKRFVEHP